MSCITHVKKFLLSSNIYHFPPLMPNLYFIQTLKPYLPSRLLFLEAVKSFKMLVNIYQQHEHLLHLTLRTKIKGTLFTYIVYQGWWWILAWKALHVAHAIVICCTLTSLTWGWPSRLGNPLCKHSCKFFHSIFLIWLEFPCHENST
jgi:hypothetical protein